MSLDKAVREFLAAAMDAGPAELSPIERRHLIQQAGNAMYQRTGTPAEAVYSVTDHHILLDSGTVSVRVYRPGPGIRPAHLFLHGGAFWLSSVDELVNDALCRNRANSTGVVVVAVDYRLAPEHPFPVPFEDSHAALRWLVDSAADLAIDPENLSVGGISAGANLAAAVALAARDHAHPVLRLQLLEVPVLDLTLATMRASGIGDEFGNTLHDMMFATRLYLPNTEDEQHRYASPLSVDDLTGLPPAHIMTAEFDPLRLDGQRYAQRLRDAGVPVSATTHPGAVHGSLSLTGVWAPAREWRDEANTALIRAHQGATETGTTDTDPPELDDRSDPHPLAGSTS